MTKIVSAISKTQAPETLPDDIEVETVEDLNGQFAPQTGNVQPEITTIANPVQVNIVHTPDGDPKPATAYIDDWATIATLATLELLERVKTNPDIVDPSYLPTQVPTLPIAQALPEVNHERPEGENPQTVEEKPRSLDSATAAQDFEAEAEADFDKVVHKNVDKPARRAKSVKVK